MLQINNTHYIDELRENLKAKDPIKANIILSHLNQMDKSVRKRILLELSKAEEEFVVPLLALFVQDNATLAEETGLKELYYSKIIENPQILIRLLQHEEIKDKSVLIQTAGKVGCQNAVPIIVNMLRQNIDPEITKVCLLALGNIGDPETINDISDYLYSGDRELTKTAIRALKEMETSQAVERLVERVGTDHEIDKLILDTLAEIQDLQSIHALNDLLLSHDAEIRNHAKSKLVQIGSKAVPILLENLQSDNVDLLIHTLNVLEFIGDISAAYPIRKFLYNEPKDANVRFAAYETLGKLPLKKGAFLLTAGLSDPELQVRVAAARALERNLDPTIIAGIKNLISGNTEEAHGIIESFINAGADQVFLQLLDEKIFMEHALRYLREEAHPDIKKHFAALLKETGREKLAEEILPEPSKHATKDQIKIFAVDDSRMILSIYKSMLYKFGYQTQLFEFPESALEQLEKITPDILITDLNMPNITGIELTRRVRKKYPKNKLPILMVTTQQDIEDKEAAFEAGVDEILYKPFKEDELKNILEKLLE